MGVSDGPAFAWFGVWYHPSVESYVHPEDCTVFNTDGCSTDSFQDAQGPPSSLAVTRAALNAISPDGALQRLQHVGEAIVF